MHFRLSVLLLGCSRWAANQFRIRCNARKEMIAGTRTVPTPRVESGTQIREVNGRAKKDTWDVDQKLSGILVPLRSSNRIQMFGKVSRVVELTSLFVAYSTR